MCQKREHEIRFEIPLVFEESVKTEALDHVLELRYFGFRLGGCGNDRPLAMPAYPSSAPNERALWHSGSRVVGFLRRANRGAEHLDSVIAVVSASFWFLFHKYQKPNGEH